MVFSAFFLCVSMPRVRGRQALNRGLQLRERRNLTGSGAERDRLRNARSDCDGERLTLRHGALGQEIGRRKRVCAGTKSDSGGGTAR